MPDLAASDSMGETAENVARAYAVSREDQDVYALASMCFGVGQGAAMVIENPEAGA